MKALPPGRPEDFTVETGLSMAIEGINLSIATMLADPRQQHRYAEVMRLATIGKALERQRARASKRVRDFVPPDAPKDGDAAAFDDYRNLGGRGPQGRGGIGAVYNCNIGGRRGDLDDIEALGDEPVGAPGDQDPLDPMDGPHQAGYGGGAIMPDGLPHMGGAHLGAPFNVAGGVDTSMQGMVATLGGVFAGIASERKSENESGRRLDRAKEIDSLSRALEKTDDPERRKRLQRLIDQATIKLEESNDDQQPPAPPPPADTWAEDASCPVEDDEGRVVCTSATCGVVHGDHWRTQAGTPRDCDICGSPMQNQQP